jgi:sigma-E factor negative regulatory protein RseC
MLEEEGVVLAVSGDMAEVLATKKSACGGCAARSGCGTSLVESLFPQRSRAFHARNEAAAKEGDLVIIGLDESALQIASLLVYLVPLLGLITGAIGGSWLGTQPAGGYAEAFSILGGVGGFFLSLLLVRRYSDVLSRTDACQARVLRVISPDNFVLPDMDLHGLTKG